MPSDSNSVGLERTSCTSVKFLVEGVGGPSCWSRDHPLSSKVLGHSFPGSSGGKEFTCNAGDPTLIPRSGRSPEKRDRLPTPVFLGFSGGSNGKEFACNMGDLGLIPRLGRSPGGEHGNPLQYSCLGNPHGQRSLVGYSPWVHQESDITEQLSTAQIFLSGKGSLT